MKILGLIILLLCCSPYAWADTGHISHQLKRLADAQETNNKLLACAFFPEGRKYDRICEKLVKGELNAVSSRSSKR